MSMEEHVRSRNGKNVTVEDLLRGKMRSLADLPRIKRSQLDVETVRSFLEDHLGCTQKEVAHGLGMKYDRVRRAMTILRAEWQTRERKRRLS